MNLPSPQYIFKKSSQTVKRFPLALVPATMAAVLAACLFEISPDEPDYIYSLILTAILGIPLFTATQLIQEKRDWNLYMSVTIKAIALVVLILYCFLLPNNLDQAPAYHLYRYALYFIGFHLLVAVGPFWSKDDVNGFWQYNKILLLRFLTAVFFSGVLYVGLSLALASIDALFGVDIDGETYLQLFALLGGIFNTWFFLAGIPKSIERLNTIDDYPKGLKVFTQNILIPLVIIYLAILYLYAGKILIQWAWPEGWVANLILGFSIVGILAVLLLHPIQEKVENQWIKRFSKGFFWLLVPLVILLLLAIWRRLWEYGFTIERYFVLISGLWLAGIVLYFIFSKAKNIKLIPTSLFLITFLISFGPWGAFSISEQSQIHRLQTFLQQKGILKKGSIHPISDTMPFEDRQEVSSIVRYLAYNHGVNSLQPWFEQDLTKLTTETEDSDSTRVLSQYEKPEKIVELMGIEYIGRQRSQNFGQEVTHFSTTEQEAVPLTDYEWLIRDVYITHDDSKTISINGKKVAIAPKKGLPALGIYLSNDSTSALTIDYGGMIQELQQKFSSKNYAIPPEEMSITASNQYWMVKIYFHRIDWEDDKKYILFNAQFDLLLSFNADSTNITDSE